MSCKQNDNGLKETYEQYWLHARHVADERDVDRLLADEGIVRNGRKIRGTIENAQVMQQLIAEHGSFHAYLSTLDDLPWKKRRKTLSDAFRYFGPTGVYFLLWSVGEEVPPWEERDQ